jgi:hypothetical protein
MTTILKAAALAFVAVLAVALATRIVGGRLGRVTSWWRTPWHNSGVGGMDGSAHILGWAVDIVPVNAATEAAARAIFPAVANEGDHIHAAWFRV